MIVSTIEKLGRENLHLPLGSAGLALLDDGSGHGKAGQGGDEKSLSSHFE